MFVSGSALLAVAIAYLSTPTLGWVCFSLALLARLFFHLKYFARLQRWSLNPSPHHALDGDGIWHEVFYRLYRHEKKLRGDIQDRDAELADFAAAIQALSDGVVMLDRDNRLLWCNRAAEGQLGLNRRTDGGQSVVNIVRQPEFVRYLEEQDFSRPLPLRADRQGERFLSVHVLAYADSKRLLQIEDITQRERLERVRRDFVANVSHELRTPLTVLRGFLETVQDLSLEPEQERAYLQMMSEQSERMQRIVDDLLSLSSLEAAPPPPENGRVDMVGLLDKLKRDGEALSGGRHHLTLQCSGNGDLRGAESEITSALANLVSNAVRYTPAGGQIRLLWTVGPIGAEFAVEDTGIGIEAQHLSRLTERFYRVDRSRSRETGGTGLGLAIVKHALTRHQAVLDIQSRPGQGSRFAARFPAARVLPQ